MSRQLPALRRRAGEQEEVRAGSACGRTEILTRSEGPSRLVSELSEQPVWLSQISSSDRKFKCAHSQLHTKRTLKAKPKKKKSFPRCEASSRPASLLPSGHVRFRAVVFNM